MFKIIGALLVITAVGGFVCGKSQAAVQKYNNLKEMIKALTYLKQELSFSAGELGVICRSIGGRTQAEISHVFLKISNILEKRTTDFSQAWREATEGNILFCAQAEVAVLDFVNNLGKKSLDIELENISKTKEILEEIETAEREKTAKDKKLLYTLGVSFAVALVILII